MLLLVGESAVPPHGDDVVGVRVPERGEVLVSCITPDRVKQLIEVGEPVFLFDLRETEKFKRERLPGAVSLPLKELPAHMAKVPRTGRVVLYCTCGPGNIEEAYGYQLLRDQGYRNVSVLVGGITEWMKRGYPVDKEPRS